MDLIETCETVISCSPLRALSLVLRQRLLPRGGHFAGSRPAPRNGGGGGGGALHLGALLRSQVVNSKVHLRCCSIAKGLEKENIQWFWKS